MADIRVFHTHIEIYPYIKGDCIQIEQMMSKRDTANKKKFIPVSYYIENDTLYLPRGISVNIIANYFHSTPIPVHRCDEYDRIKKGVGLKKPKNRIQENAIKFLCGIDEYAFTAPYSQLGLNLMTGDGKTYASIYSILKMKIKAIIIMHQTKIKNQWIETLETMTSIPKERICNIEGSEIIDKIMRGKIVADIYLVNHQTISAYARSNGWYCVREFFKKIKVGIKVIDEAHKFFSSILMIDYFSNCYKTFYVTATFGRTDHHEISIYKRAFSSLVRFGEETINYEEKRKHTIFIVCYFESKPDYGSNPSVRTRHGFSDYKYIDYELTESKNSLMKVLYYILDNISGLQGRILVTSPKVDSVKYIAEKIENYTGKEVGTIHGKNSDSVNEENKSKEIISSTIRSIGEGADISKLRILINLTPIGSSILADQVQGRLREYSPDDDTFLFYPVDIKIKDCVSALDRIMPTMKKKCKKIITMHIPI